MVQRILSILFCSFLFACSTLDQRWESNVEQVLEGSCAFATLSIALTYHVGQITTEEDVANRYTDIFGENAVLNAAQSGIKMSKLKTLAESFGFTVRHDRFSLEQLSKYAKVIPTIVYLEERGFNIRTFKMDRVSGHFAIVKGVGEEVLLADPAYGNRYLSPSEFLKMWHNNRALYLVPTQSTLRLQLLKKPESTSPAFESLRRSMILG